MAAHLDLIYLRRHALPVHFITAAGQPADASVMPGLMLDVAARSRLVASWRLDAGGRLVCAWAMDADNPPLLPA